MAGMCVDGELRGYQSKETAKQDVQVSVGKDFVIMGGIKVEVSPDGKKVTAYANRGVETKAASGTAAPGISISADFNTVVLNGATIERAADGHIVISSPGTVINKPAPANDAATKPKTVPGIGDEMEDGTIFAGISPDTNMPIYARPKDESGVFAFDQAAKHATNLDAHGHHDFRVPSKSELNVLYENRDKGKLKGTFNGIGLYPAGWYWSSSSNFFNHSAWARRFSDGYQKHFYSKYNDSSLRLVR